jgi:HD-GYP domain-containing protein (c-di-GMP phosphodiesterase class II)
VNTTLLAIEMGRAAGMRVADLRVLGIGALLHDVGKGLVVPEAIDDPGRLGPEQWRLLKKYPSRSALVILEAAEPGTEVAAVIAFEHAVRHDLTGYPEMPEAHRQHPAAALLSVVDVYDAVTSRRPYRRAETNGNALQILLDGAGTQFAPGMVRLFVKRFGTVPPGSCFRLRSGEVLVASGNAGDEGRVRGLVVEDASGQILSTPRPEEVKLKEIEGELSIIESRIRPAAYLDYLEGAERRTPE